jgi:site-specific recombinase XerD
VGEANRRRPDAGAQAAHPESVERFLASIAGSRPATIRTYGVLLGEYVRWNGGAAEIGRERHDRYLLFLRRRGKSQNTLHINGVVLRRYATFLDVPTSGWQRPKSVKPPIDPLKPEEVDLLRGAMGKGKVGRAHRFVFEMLLNTGLRAGELVRLRWQDVDLVDHRITVRDSKGGKSRVIIMLPDAHKALVDRLDREYPGRSWQEARMMGDPVSPIRTDRGLNRMLQSAASRAGFDMRRVHAHLLRHTIAVDLALRQGVTLRSLQRFLGHSSLETTSRYLQYDMGEEEPKFLRTHVGGETKK